MDSRLAVFAWTHCGSIVQVAAKRLSPARKTATPKMSLPHGASEDKAEFENAAPSEPTTPMLAKIHVEKSSTRFKLPAGSNSVCRTCNCFTSASDKGRGEG